MKSTQTTTSPKLSGTLDLCVESLNLKYDANSKSSYVLKNIDLNVPGGQTLTLLGPSGCGKTSLLRAIAGLETPMSGRIAIGNRVLFDSSKNLKPEHRQIGMVFQDLALFPHLSVGGNVAYGLPRGEQRSKLTMEALALVHLQDYENRRISTLSGGQQQRVALARALAPKPKVLLLDEPFASLDEPTRIELRNQIHHLLADLQTTAVFVTHDQEEAFILGDQVAVMNEAGQIEQQDHPTNIYTHPVSRWVADFVGTANLVSGISDGTFAATCLGKIALQEPAPVAGTEIDVLIRPESLRITSGNSVKIQLVEYYGHDILYLVSLLPVEGPGQNTSKNADNGGANTAQEKRVWVRAVTNFPEYSRGSMADIQYIGPPALAFQKRTSPRN